MPEMGWLEQNNQRGTIVLKNANTMEFSVEALDDGEIYIELNGSSEPLGENKWRTNWLKFSEFTVNGRSVIDADKYVWPDKHVYTHILDAKKGDIFQVHLKWRKVQ